MSYVRGRIIRLEDLRPADILYIHSRLWLKDRILFNTCVRRRLGVYIGDGIVIVRGKKRCFKKNISPYLFRHILAARIKKYDDELGLAVRNYLLRNYPSSPSLEMALTQLLQREDPHAFFSDPTDFPKFNNFITQDEYDKKWEELKKVKQPGDTIFVQDRKSLIAWLIRKIDYGSIWNHLAISLENDEIGEIIFKGYAITSIEKYKSTRFRVGIYRFKSGLTEEQVNKAMQFSYGFRQKGYPFTKVIFVGIVILLGKFFKLKIKHPLTSVNLLLCGEFKLVGYI